MRDKTKNKMSSFIMGKFCWSLPTVERTASESSVGNGLEDQQCSVSFEPDGAAQSSCKAVGLEEPVKKQKFNEHPLSLILKWPMTNNSSHQQSLVDGTYIGGNLSGESSQKSKATGLLTVASDKDANGKVFEVTSRSGRGVSAELCKAKEVVIKDCNLGPHLRSEFTGKSSHLGILSLEVANMFVKASNLKRSLSKESIKYLKEVVLHSEGVQRLVSTDMNELLRIVVADKREEIKAFSDEVVRFGNLCNKPQWHNLDRHFAKLQLNCSVQKRLKEITPKVMQNLMPLVQNTSELYHELCALDKMEKDYKWKLREKTLFIPVQKGGNVKIIEQELKSHHKHVERLKKKSLWSKNLEEILPKLVNIVHFLYLEINDAFGIVDVEKPVEEFNHSHQRLGSAGLALHYANIVHQIDVIASRPSCITPSMRDALYQALPPGMKSTLRSKLQTFENKATCPLKLHSNLTARQVQEEIDKTLMWLVPLSINTSRALQGFGWVGEWAKMGTEAQRKTVGQFNVIKIGTLHYADKERTETCILDLVLLLQLLIHQCRPLVRARNKTRQLKVKIKQTREFE